MPHLTGYRRAPVTYLDPARAVECPTCTAKPGAACQIRDRELSSVHATRRTALEERNAQTRTIR